MTDDLRRRVVLAYAGPNGSGKTTVTRKMESIGTYVNADEIKIELGITDIEAAQEAERLRNHLLEERSDFSFETVMSTERNLILLQKAKKRGYTVKCIYVLTCDPEINVWRVRMRYLSGEGHNVDEDKVRSRYYKALKLLPSVIEACDGIIVFDNSGRSPNIIFSKNAQMIKIYPNEYWSEEQIKNLVSEIK